MESAMYTAKVPMPDHLGEWIEKSLESLEQAILEEKK
jgi:hypothetical protein